MVLMIGLTDQDSGPLLLNADRIVHIAEHRHGALVHVEVTGSRDAYFVKETPARIHGLIREEYRAMTRHLIPESTTI